MTHVQRIESRLGISQGRLHLRCLEHLRGMIGRDAQRLSAIYDILAQSDGERGDTLLCRLLADGVIVQRTEHTRETGIIEITIAFTHHLLQDHRHLLLVDHVLRGEHIGLRILIIH